MNEKQPYEKHLGEKLQQLSPPHDAHRSWPQMRSILDQHMPEDDGNDKGGYGRWHVLGLLAILLITGTWFYMRNGRMVPAHVQIASMTPSASSGEKAVLPAASKDLANGIAKNEKPAEQVAATSHSSSRTQEQPSTAAVAGNGSGTAAPAGKAGQLQPAENKAAGNIGHTNNSDDDVVSNVNNLPNSKERNKTSGNKSTQPKYQEDRNQPAIESAKPIVRNGNTDRGRGHNFPQAGNADKSKAGRDQALVNASSKTDASRQGIKGPSSIASSSLSVDKTFSPSKLPAISNRTGHNGNTAELVPDPLQADYAAAPKSVSYDKAKLRRLLRFGSQSGSATRRKSSPRTVGTGDNKNFAFGFSLPLAFPLADQKPIGYNISAGANTVSDYLPAPHFQYHFNDKSYIQTEVQFFSPQYIQPVLLYQDKHELQGASSYRYVTNSIYARKLYYFNIPVGLHYSPFRNFYLGTGLQFSSLLSGIAQYEERGYTSWAGGADTLYNQQFRRFRNDSISNRLDASEFRLLLDANYYWNRFTVGFRYNQALSNYISIRVVPNISYFEDKNKSLQFYLRYNLWEDKKRKRPGGNLLSSK